MRVLLYFENEKILKKSGIGRALSHQKLALSLNEIEYTTNKSDSFDIAHINTYHSKSLALVKYCKKNNIPVIVHGHSTKEDFKNSFKFWKLLQKPVYRSMEKVYSKPDLIITPTNYSKGLIENYNFVKCPVVAVSNGIDLKKYANLSLTDEEAEELKERFGINNNEKIVMGIGWFFERKGFQDFIEIARSLPDTKFIWFGQKTSFLYTKIINHAIKTKPDNVILPGYVPQEVIVKMLHLANCFFFPSYEETEGIVLLEALAAKTPVLVRDIDVFDYLTHEVDCLKANNNESFISKIRYILDNDCTNMKENGFKIAQERDLKLVGIRLKEEYEELLKRKETPDH